VLRERLIGKEFSVIFSADPPTSKSRISLIPRLGKQYKANIYPQLFEGSRRSNKSTLHILSEALILA
jgi:3-deoxy-D-arabino-heptulosonate 7-phosphate (DAHP) synthase class II